MASEQSTNLNNLNNLIINSKKFSYVVNKLRTFFLNKGFIEVHTQNRLSILAACEDPTTISIFNYANSRFPLPQTGQMWLEHEIMNDPEPPGYFCVSTSYRNEPNPIPGRHDLVFPMFEFEFKGDMIALKQLETELLIYLGYKPTITATDGTKSFASGNYLDVARELNTLEIEHVHEMSLYKDMGNPVFFLMNFPEYTSPFWNMKRSTVQSNDNGCAYNQQTANKIDVILSGMETIGSAERSCDADEMRHRFETISGGMYARTLYNHFGKERVDKELNDFFKLSFMTRSGAGIGVTRLIRSMELEGLLFN